MSTREEAADALTRIYRQADPSHPRVHLPESAPREAECFIPAGCSYKIIVVSSLRKKWNGAHLRAVIYGAPFDQNARRRQGCIAMRDGLSAPAWVETIVYCDKTSPPRSLAATSDPAHSVASYTSTADPCGITFSTQTSSAPDVTRSITASLKMLRCGAM